MFRLQDGCIQFAGHLLSMRLLEQIGKWAVLWLLKGKQCQCSFQFGAYLFIFFTGLGQLCLGKGQSFFDFPISVQRKKKLLNFLGSKRYAQRATEDAMFTESTQSDAIVADGSRGNDRCRAATDAVCSLNVLPLGCVHFARLLESRCDCPVCSVQSTVQRQLRLETFRPPL